jgi:Zn finger protein HypA/HybF involved in hydrogenase expression
MTDEKLKYFSKITNGGIPKGELRIVMSGTGGRSQIQTILEQQLNLKCWCQECCKKETGEYNATRVVVCPDCGNKRCPRATNHELECSGSNEPGQKGSIY